MMPVFDIIAKPLACTAFLRVCGSMLGTQLILHDLPDQGFGQTVVIVKKRRHIELGQNALHFTRLFDHVFRAAQKMQIACIF